MDRGRKMLANVGIWQLLIVLVIAIVLFGSGRIKQLGEDFGGMIKGFRKEMKGVSKADVVKDINTARKTISGAKKIFKK